VTADTGAYVTVVRPNIAAGWPKRAKPTLHAADGICGSFTILKEVFLTLTLGRRPLKIWVYVTNITNEFVLGLEILNTYDAYIDLGRQILHLAEEEVSLCSPRAGPLPSSLVVTSDHMIPAQCMVVVMA
jgi:hypothetical protein